MPSSIRPPRDGSSRSRLAFAEVTIDDWPLRDRPLSSAFALALAAGASWLAVLATGSPRVGAIVAVMLSLTLWRTCLPVRYQLTSGGVVQSVLGWRRRIGWSSIHRYELHTEGALLSPDSAITSLSPLRGLYLPWGTQREAVISQLEYYLPASDAAASDSTRSRASARQLAQSGR
jgi:hypothetical protein